MRRGASIIPGGWRWFEPWVPISAHEFVGAEVDRLDSGLSFSRIVNPTGEQKGAGLNTTIPQCDMRWTTQFEQTLMVSTADILPAVRKMTHIIQLVDREIVSVECEEQVHTTN